MFRNVICFMLYEDKKFNFSQDRNFFFSHVLHVYISFIFVLYCVKPFVSVYFCHKYTYIPTRLDAEAPGPRALRAGRQEAEAPGPALCRPVAIHTRLGVGRAGSQQAPPSTNLGVTGHPGPAAEARLVMSKKLAHIYIPGLTPRRAARGLQTHGHPMYQAWRRAGRQPASTDLRVTGRLKPHVIPKPKNL